MKVEAKIDRGRVEILEEECKGCGLCVAACPVHVMRLADYLNSRGYHPAQYLGAGCTGCGVCFYACPEPGAMTVYTLESPAKEVVGHSSLVTGRLQMACG